jgi:hypothetical protein
MTGQEGPTGGLTTAMRFMLHGDFAEGASRHRATVWVFAFLCAQLAWRSFVVLVRPKLPMPRTWIADLIISFALFGAAIYIPWWTR